MTINKRTAHTGVASRANLETEIASLRQQLAVVLGRIKELKADNLMEEKAENKSKSTADELGDIAKAYNIPRLTDIARRIGFFIEDVIAVEAEMEVEIAQLKRQLAAAQERERWIPVTERLPEKEGEYLCKTKNTCIVLYYRNGFYYSELLTHWRKLPELPKEDQ